MTEHVFFQWSQTVLWPDDKSQGGGGPKSRSLARDRFRLDVIPEIKPCAWIVLSAAGRKPRKYWKQL
jgi:hypothetical protein